jgi:glyoxylase-like metal-dependent hydrolase (beta-lactamase superfamily II)
VRVTSFLCTTCGTQYPPSSEPPPRCPICEDERQYVGLDGQKWTTLGELRRDRKNVFDAYEPGLTAIRTVPPFAINQRAFLIESPQGHVLWDCIALLDQATTDEITRRGGLRAIAISHPHYYTTMVEWSRAFGSVPVYLHADDREHVVCPDPCLHFWEGETLALHDDITLIRCGGHFEGGTVLHSGRTLLTGDIIQVVPDRRWVSFMRSYPNYIPLSADKVRQIVAAVEPFEFDRVYGAFYPLQVEEDGKKAVRRSAERYIRAIGIAGNSVMISNESRS